MINKMKSIKLLGWLFLFASAFILLWFDKIDQNVWADVATWSFVALVAGNGVTKIARAFGNNKEK